MMIVAITVRDDQSDRYGQEIDSLEQSWYKLASSCGFALAPLPNDLASAGAMLDRIRPDAVILSGGGTIQELSGDDKVRDRVERLAIAYARLNKLPILAVCRGMQKLLSVDGVVPVKTPGHLGVEHAVSCHGDTIPVNSYHEFAFADLPAAYIPLAVAEDKTIEATVSACGNHLCLMWHPERNDPIRGRDIAMIKNHFQKNTKE